MTEKGTQHGDFEEIVQVRKYADHCVLTKSSSGLEPRKGAGETEFPRIVKQPGSVNASEYHFGGVIASEQLEQYAEEADGAPRGGRTETDRSG